MGDQDAIRGLAAGAFALYGAYKLYQLVSGSGGEDAQEGSSRRRSIDPEDSGNSWTVQSFGQPHLQMIDQLPFYNKPVRIVTSPSACKMAVAELRKHCNEYPVLGLDCEWNNWYERFPVALLQLATNQGLCVLIRLCKMDSIPSTLNDLLSDGKIKKVGVEVKRDMQYLYNDYQLVGNGAVDLRDLAKRCGVPPPHGLAGLAEKTLKIKMDKTYRMSDWEADELSDAEIKYAAHDALVGIELFRKYAETLYPRSPRTSQKAWIQQVVKQL
nr:exonuclease 3'-5' domain-containing protein 2-like [Aedes albopictus]